MDPNTGNIYNTEEAKKLGLEFESLIPLTHQQAEEICAERRELVGESVDEMLANLTVKAHRARSMKQPAGMPWDKR